MEQKSFTESFKNLQRVATDIGKQATTLEDALNMFEEGMKEADYCKSILDKADQRISVYNEEEQDA